MRSLADRPRRLAVRLIARMTRLALVRAGTGGPSVRGRPERASSANILGTQACSERRSPIAMPSGRARRRAMICRRRNDRDDQVFAGDPFAPRQLLEEGFVEASGSPSTARYSRLDGQDSLGACSFRSPSSRSACSRIEQQGQPLAMVEFAGLGIVVGSAKARLMPCIAMTADGWSRQGCCSMMLLSGSPVNGRAADVGVIDRRSVRGLARCAALEIVA